MLHNGLCGMGMGLEVPGYCSGGRFDLLDERRDFFTGGVIGTIRIRDIVNSIIPVESVIHVLRLLLCSDNDFQFSLAKQTIPHAELVGYFREWTSSSPDNRESSLQA